VVERQTRRVGHYGLSPVAVSRWNLGGLLLILFVGSMTMLSAGPLLDVLRNAFIGLLAYWIVFASVNSLMARCQVRRPRPADRRISASRIAGSGRSLPWHPAQGPPIDAAAKTMQPYELGPELPSLN